MWELRWIWGPWAHPEILNFACSIRVHAVFGLGALEIKAQCFVGAHTCTPLFSAPHLPTERLPPTPHTVPGNRSGAQPGKAPISSVISLTLRIRIFWCATPKAVTCQAGQWWLMRPGIRGNPGLKSRKEGRFFVSGALGL